ncbi:hypothetical protein QFZ48_005828 [Chitinophaga sp. W2I13]|uniref:hypothetical protein n=1 Tax=Chitinophaga sp. W2I13 TaxID=3373923 RepID=UPI003D1C1B52
MDKIWESIIFRALRGEKNVPSPFAKDGVIESLFVVVKEQGTTKLGYGFLWCSVTFRGIHLSRMEVPDYLHPVTIDELKNIKLPDIKFEHLK